MPQEPAADLVLRGAAVTTVDPARPAADAVAVRGGRIVAVGSDADVAGLVGARTRVVEGRGRTVLPGFQDAHVHPPSSGLDELLCDVREPTGELPLERVALVDRIRAYAAAHPDAPWILGSGWYMGAFPNGTPHRHDLDAAVGGRPAFLPNRDGHSAWVSSRALELAGIGPGTPDPPLGRIERDPDGTPSGVVHEAAMDLVERFIPPATQADLEAGLLRAQAELHALGITSWQDAIVRTRRARRLPGRRGSRRADGPRRRGPVVGAGVGRAGGRRPARAPGGRNDRPLPGGLGEGHGRRRPRDVHRGDARAVPAGRRWPSRPDRHPVLRSRTGCAA